MEGDFDRQRAGDRVSGGHELLAVLFGERFAVKILQFGGAGLGERQHQVADGVQLVTEHSGRGLAGKVGLVVLEAAEKRLGHLGVGCLERGDDFIVDRLQFVGERLGGDVLDLLRAEGFEGVLEARGGLLVILDRLALAIAVFSGGVNGALFDRRSFTDRGVELLLGGVISGAALGADEVECGDTDGGATDEAGDELVILDPTHGSALRRGLRFT